MDSTSRNKIKNEYKQAAQHAGVFKITNTANGKVYIGSSVNVPARLNRFRSELQFGGCKIKSMQEDWNKFGSDIFAFETLELLDPDGDVKDITAELAALEELILEQFQPFGENGYNTEKAS